MPQHSTVDTTTHLFLPPPFSPTPGKPDSKKHGPTETPASPPWQHFQEQDPPQTSPGSGAASPKGSCRPRWPCSFLPVPAALARSHSHAVAPRQPGIRDRRAQGRQYWVVRKRPQLALAKGVGEPMAAGASIDRILAMPPCPDLKGRPLCAPALYMRYMRHHCTRDPHDWDRKLKPSSDLTRPEAVPHVTHVTGSDLTRPEAVRVCARP